MVSVRLVRAAAAAAFTAFACSLFLPLPRTYAKEDEEIYVCAWEDGSSSAERYSSACSRLVGAGENKIYLERDGVRGEIEAGGAFARAVGVFERGTLAELLSFRPEKVTRLESAALFCKYGKRLWYDGALFRWTGSEAVRADIAHAEEVVLMAGGLPESLLRGTGAERLVLRRDADLSASALVGSSVTQAVAEEPYFVDAGGIYYTVPNGKRFIAALPDTTALRIGDDTVYCDTGALAPCGSLRELSLPFVGNTLDMSVSDRIGDFGCLFGTDRDGRYLIPQSLTRLEVRGGMIPPYVFFGCTVERISCCGVPAENVSPFAFTGCEPLVLHAPAEGLLPAGKYSARPAPCGCTVYEKKSD